MYIPSSTYRIQFNKEFTFSHLEKIIPYLSGLGIGAVYASPIFTAVPGSMHGYDVTDAQHINPEIGTEEQLFRISKQLREKGIGWIQDIVPNHMAFHCSNKWLMHVLEHGKGSPYASWFDIFRDEPSFHEKLMLPFLENTLEDALTKKQLQVKRNRDQIVLCYGDQDYPVNRQSFDELNVHYSDEDRTIEALNADVQLMVSLIHKQHYLLCGWKESSQRINYRRFFTVNGLICLNMQNQHVFDAYHKYIKWLVDEKIFDGVRVDHIDGLADPGGYLHNLRNLLGDDVYITVEKILQENEQLPAWPVQGNTGYDFLGIMNRLFASAKNETLLTDFYHSLTGAESSIGDETIEKKSLILHGSMNGELTHLVHLFIRLFPEEADEIEETLLRKTIAALLLACPVYRYYFSAFPLQEEEQKALAELIGRSRSLLKEDEQAGIDMIEKMLRNPGNKENSDHAHACFFFKRLMQFSGPLMAKGVEDTLMYTFNRLIAHNEVGDTPAASAIDAEQFHRIMLHRQQHWPFTLNAASTHDTKRGEDARARLHVLGEAAKEWIAKVKEWQTINSALKSGNIPDANEEYFIYQALVAICRPGDDLKERMEEYIRKSLREAKTHSTWDQPDEAYEQAVLRFCSKLLDPAHPFIQNLDQWVKQVEQAAAVNILSQQLLKFTCPGIPDTYQGTEWNDYSLVDPDNRKPVDYQAREAVLQEAGVNDHKNISIGNEHAKLVLTRLLMQERKQYPDVFAHGSYVPLQVTGAYKTQVLAFARQYARHWYITIVPLHIHDLADASGHIDWKDTCVVLPGEVPSAWKNIITGEEGKTTKELSMNELLNGSPVALLRLMDKPTDRGAGILAHITSLPSAFGIGDMGPGAYAFVDFLGRSRQKYWQLLPISATGRESDYSPYSAVSSIAGNPLLISPELLSKEGLLTNEELEQHQMSNTGRVDYEEARQRKYDMMGLAWKRFCEGSFVALKAGFEKFCDEESYWLEDFTLYVTLREQHDHDSWVKWPAEYKDRDPQALAAFGRKSEDEIRQVKFRQFIFFRQWEKLKKYCHAKGVQLIGDLPFYMSLDAVDVWANRELFALDEKGNVNGIAGVPPDYFSEDGQLWGMPVYNWEKLNEQDYAWWISRLQKNLQLYDLLRLDHFRAFESYWKVPAGEATARNGEWIKGPGKHFFERVYHHLGKMPFVAEDLGEEMEKVYAFRDEVGLPGMKVLQFAFGENMPHAVDIPHTYTGDFIVYTGTHDNNTTLGWFNKETKAADRQRIEQYTGIKPAAKNINRIMTRLAYASVARIAIIPVQDVLGLDEDHRMNIPGTSGNNWRWRMLPGQPGAKEEDWLKELVMVFGR